VAAFEGILILADIREAAFGRSSALTEPLGDSWKDFVPERRLRDRCTKDTGRKSEVFSAA